MSAAAGGGANPLKGCRKVLTQIMQMREASPFLEPVKWKEWGLHDYPVLIKHPMDLGTVLQKLEGGKYDSVAEFAKDVNLVWSNCMTYNRDDSEYYKMAAKLEASFADKMAKLQGSDPSATSGVKQPLVSDKKYFCESIFKVSGEDLGRAVEIINKRCPGALKRINADELEIDVDEVDNETFWEAERFVSECLPQSRKSGKRRRAEDGDGSGKRSRH